MRWSEVIGVLTLLSSAHARYLTSDSEALKRVLTDNQGIIEWLVEHIEDAIKELEKASTVRNYECLVGMAYVLQDTYKGKMWALSMIDSSAKIPNGILQAGFNDLGVYDECVAIENPNPEMPFTGMHCLVDFKITVPENVTFEIDGSSMKISTLLGSNVVTLTLGHCYPSVCEPSVIESAYNLLLSRVSNMTGGSYGIEVVINPSDCHLADRDALQTPDWLVLMVIAILLFAAALSTTLDVAYFRHVLRDRQPTPGEQAAISFSLYSNGKKLLNLQKGAESIESLNGLKFISIGWVVLAHRYRYMALEPISNFSAFPPALKQWHKMVILSAPLAVDTFFLISGLLNMYSFMWVRSKRRSYNILHVITGYVHRYIRLTPSYAMAVAFTATLLYRLGNGPEWDRIVGKVKNECADGWWANVLYINNYGVDNYCMLQSWYLSADMQMFWAAPFVLYPLWRWPVVGFVELGILLVLSVASPFYVAWHYQIAAPIPVTNDEHMKNMIMRKLYLPTHTKFTSYVVGIFIGYAMYKIRKGQWNLRINKITNMGIWAASAVLMLYAVFGGFPLFQLDYTYNQFHSSFYIGFYRLFWSMGIAWIVLACDNGWGGPINAFLSWEMFSPLGKLTYCIYLIHVGVMLVGVGSVRSAIHYSDYSEVHSFLGDMVLCVVVAAAFSLLLEAPLMNLEKLVFEPGKRTKTLKPVDIDGSPVAEPIVPSAPQENGSELMKRRATLETTQL